MRLMVVLTAESLLALPALLLAGKGRSVERVMKIVERGPGVDLDVKVGDDLFHELGKQFIWPIKQTSRHRGYWGFCRGGGVLLSANALQGNNMYALMG